MTHDEVEHCVFVEYVCVVQRSIQEFVRRAAAQRADLAELPIAQSFDTRHW
jgi:hypothetical protein